jgi:hypothetical protein
VTLEDRLHQSLLLMLGSKGIEARQVTGFQDGIQTAGYDRADDQIRVEILYLDHKKVSQVYTESGSFGDLIKTLADFSE